jgi:hypothetical protein
MTARAGRAVPTRTSATGSSRAAWLRSVVLPLGLSLLCLRSVFHTGYLLQVDIAFGPRPGPVAHGIAAPVSALQAGAVRVLGGEIAGKVYAVTTLFLAGFTPMVLFRRAPWYAQGAAGFLGAMNPFVYDRLVEGQWYVVIAAAGLFLWLGAWEALQARPGPACATLLAVCGAAIVGFDPHTIGPLAVLTLVAAAWGRRRRDPARLRWTAASIGLLVLLLLPGVVSFFLGSSPGEYSAVRQFTRADFAFFRSTSSPDYGLLVNLIGLYGYWGERIGRFPLATGGAVWWPVTTALVVAAALLGAWLRRDRRWLLACGVIGLAMSASTAVPGGVRTAAWLASRIPAVAAYREPEKWSMLWLLAIVVLAVGAIEAIARTGPEAATALAYVIVFAALVPAGVSQARALPGIVAPVTYPRYWYATAASLRRAAGSHDVTAVLPWHLYQPLRASEGRLVADPAPVFFPGRLVTPHNLEIPGRSTEILSPYDRIGLVRGASRPCRLATEIRRLGVRWVLVLDAAEGARTVVRLRRCGYALVEGRAGFTALLRVGAGKTRWFRGLGATQVAKAMVGLVRSLGSAKGGVRGQTLANAGGFFACSCRARLGGVVGTAEAEGRGERARVRVRRE